MTTKAPAKNIEFEDEFAAQYKAEVAHQGTLAATIFAMGDLLERERPDETTLRRLAREFGYRPATLLQRMKVAREIPPEHRNSKLSFTSHAVVLEIKLPDDDLPDVAERTEIAEAARFELLDNTKEGPGGVPKLLGEVTANEMRKLVRAKRVEIHQLKGPDRLFGGSGRRRVGGGLVLDALREQMSKLGRAGGFAISDQHSIVKCSAAFEEDADGDVTFTIENSSGYLIEPAINPVAGRPSKFTLTFTLAGPDEDDAEAEPEPELVSES